MRMQLVAGEQAHEIFGFEPDALVAHGAPEKDEGTAIELPAGMRKLIKLLCPTDINTAYLIACFGLLFVFSHTGLFFLLWLQPEARSYSSQFGTFLHQDREKLRSSTREYMLYVSW